MRNIHRFGVIHPPMFRTRCFPCFVLCWSRQVGTFANQPPLRREDVGISWDGGRAIASYHWQTQLVQAGWWFQPNPSEKYE